MSVLFSNIATPHTLPARLLNFWRRMLVVLTKVLEDSSKLVKSGYAAMIKMKNGLSKHGPVFV